MSSLLRLERQQKRFLKLCVEFAYFSFSFIIRSYTSLVSSKTIAIFKPKRRKNHTLRSGTYRIGLYKGSPPGYLIIFCALLFWRASITFCSSALTSRSSLNTSTIRQFIPRNIPIVKDRWIHSTLISSRLLLLP